MGAWFRTPRAVTIQAFVDGYGSIGYSHSADGSLEAGIEKIVLYGKTGPGGTLMPTHAAYQLDNGNWTSKLGDCEDIEHVDVVNLDGPQYGSVILYLRRLRQPRPLPPTH